MLAPQEIRVNLVCRGIIDTPMPGGCRVHVDDPKRCGPAGDRSDSPSAAAGRVGPIVCAGLHRDRRPASA